MRAALRMEQVQLLVLLALRSLRSKVLKSWMALKPMTMHRVNHCGRNQNP
jgi:hypothetical protein